ncbi:ankyrin repeat protein [Medicago truncatula]|uniref:Ankyrin repeat protein n=1 Tax=Medicago truncatula TaxID=3880 RepID=G7KHA3_MEDTR|nr:ankyrin repeat protein [Medicago truncatula]
MAMIGDSDNILLNISPDEVNDFLGEYTWEGKWENVIMIYYAFPEQAHKAIISDSAGTALHVAIDLDEEIVVKELVNAILTHNVEVSDERVEALEMENERGDTPLHFAASRGFARICKCIIGINNERIYLLSRKNKHGETPLFQAAINWRKQTFAYLAHISKEIVTLQDLVREDGDSILHTAIRGEYFDLAVIVVHYYDFLSTHLNKEESTPLKVLATRPSAFKSASNLSWYKRILYHCILVEPLDHEKTMRSNLRKMEAGSDSNKMKLPDNYTTLYYFFSIGLMATLFGKKVSKKKQHDTEDPSNDTEKYPVGFLPPNYETFHQFVKSAYVHTLGLSGVELKDVKIAKKKHLWSSQLLKALMKRPYAAFTGSGGRPSDREIDSDMYNVFPQWKQEQDVVKEITSSPNEIKKENEKEIKKKMTPFLVAAKNGIVEMVNEILIKVPSAIHNTTSRKENVLLVAVKYRQPLIVETLRMIKHSKPELWNNLILAMDEDENTVLHLAAEALGGDKPWQIAGSALQMMWDIKWFQYIKSLVPQHFIFRNNSSGKTSREIFKKTHKGLIKDSSEWLKDTSESCSVVSALVAGVSFATASAVPGGTTDQGRPVLEGKPAFDVFAISSLIGLCFSVTGLIMFLSILTSRKQAKDFRRDLPLKLLLGLSSLFVSIASMFVSFCTGHFFLLSHNFKSVLFPIYAATCLPVTFYAVAQFPLYFDLITAILTKVPMATDKGDNL